MKIKNPPSSAFYTEMYEIINKLISDINVLSEIDIVIINEAGYEDFVQRDDIQIGYVTRKSSKKGKLSYQILLTELHSLNFRTKEIIELINWRYSTYLTNLGLEISPEIITLLSLLHEIGHIESFESFFKLLDLDRCKQNVLTSYNDMIESTYVTIFKPWDYSGFRDVNISNIMYNSIETYPELFALKHFPIFIKTIKESGGFKNENS